MYRILMARNGYYYVQMGYGYHWVKVGGFFRSKHGARRFIEDRRGSPHLPGRVVEYY